MNSLDNFTFLDHNDFIMKFETDYKNIHFEISVERETISDVSLLMGDKFNRLPNQTMMEIKKGTLAAYNVIIVSTAGSEEFTHYLSNVILSSDESELLEEIGHYLDQEETLDTIERLIRRYQVAPGPVWRIPT